LLHNILEDDEAGISTRLLVGGAITIFNNMSSSMGRMTSHGKSSIHVPNHQPEIMNHYLN
jgi:hypothetical protein